MAGRPEDPRSEAAAPPPSTRDALMDAALDLLTERGVLAGLNLREVADRVGVTPANIYHLFGSRQGLLRAALTRELAQMRDAIADAGPLPFVARRVRMFDVIGSRPRLALTALLALDGDPDYTPLPFIEVTRAQYQQEIAAGALPSGIDIDAAHVFSLATSIAVAIYGDSAARQLEVPTEELRARLRAMLEQMLDALVSPP